MSTIVNAPKEGSAEDVTTPESSLPKELQVKSQEELAEMYLEAQRQIGKQSGEIGQLRQLMEQRMADQASSKEATEDLDFFEDPIGAIRKVVQAELGPTQREVTSYRGEATVRKLDDKFPGWRDTAKSSEFLEWAQGTPVRAQLLMLADQADYDAASELLSTWGEIHKSDEQATQQTQEAVQRDRKLRAMGSEKAPANYDPRKIYRRKDIQRLIQTRPDEYRAMASVLLRARQEGRVIDD